MFSLKYSEIFKNIYFEKHLRTTATVVNNLFLNDPILNSPKKQSYTIGQQELLKNSQFHDADMA